MGSFERSTGLISLKGTGGWPCSDAYWLASLAMVGEAKASTMATVRPRPSMPPATVLLVP